MKVLVTKYAGESLKILKTIILDIDLFSITAELQVYFFQHSTPILVQTFRC